MLNTKEKRTPFLARGNGRVRELEHRVASLETNGIPVGSIAFVETLPADHDEHPDTLYFITND